MVFLTRLNFVPSFDEKTVIIGFVVEPVKSEVKEEDTREAIMEKCDPAEAQAWQLSALTDEQSREWIADFEKETDAHTFATILQNIYRAGYNSIGKGNTYAFIRWDVSDVHEIAKKYDIILTPDEAQGFLAELADHNGKNWGDITLAIAELQRAWIDRDVLTTKGGAQAGTLTCSYPGGLPFMEFAGNLTVWYENEWRQVHRDEWTLTDPTPNIGLQFVHSEFESDISGEEGEALQYKIEHISNRPDCYELFLYKGGEEYMNSYLYDSAEEARADIRLALARFNVRFTNIGTEE